MNNIENLQEMMLPHIRRLKPYHGVDPMEVIAERAGIPSDQVIRLKHLHELSEYPKYMWAVARTVLHKN